jgi:hypothetical protein
MRLQDFIGGFPKDFADEWMEEFTPEETEEIENIFSKLLGKEHLLKPQWVEGQQIESV